VTIGAEISTFVGAAVGSGRATAPARPSVALSSNQCWDVGVRPMLAFCGILKSKTVEKGPDAYDAPYQERELRLQLQRQTRNGKRRKGNEQVRGRIDCCATCLPLIPASRFQSGWCCFGPVPDRVIPVV
jgi:hypothetical protein